MILTLLNVDWRIVLMYNCFGVLTVKKTYNKKLTNKSRTLRREATKEENHLWYDFLRNHEYKFTRQRIIDNYILDFYCAKIKLAIEIDGSQHYDEEGLIKDTERTAALNKYGISVLRFTNREINDKFEAVCEYINEFIKRKSGTVVNDSVLNRF